MTAAERARILASTWTFYAGLAAQIVGAVQIGLVALQANIPAVTFGIVNLVLGTALQVAKYLTTTPPPVDLAQKFRDAQE